MYYACVTSGGHFELHICHFVLANGCQNKGFVLGEFFSFLLSVYIF